jgi:hypothetical protein
MTEPDDQVGLNSGSPESSYAPLWQAIRDLADTWTGLPLVRRFAGLLPRNAPQRSSGIPGRLQEMEAGGAGISEHPLRVTRTMQLFQQMPSLSSQMQPASQEWDAWLDTARRAEAAHRLTVAWLRSRTPGYPNLPAPQLAPGAPLTAGDHDFRLTWTRQERAQGLQFQNPPPQIDQLLEATPTQQQQISHGMRAVAAAFERTEPWTRLDAATASLTDAARGDLAEARAEIARRLRDAEIDTHSQLVLARFNFRVAVLADVLTGLFGAASDYATAFGAVNDLLETAASDVFAELAVYGPPSAVSHPEDIDLRPGTLQLVSFSRGMSQDTGFIGFLDLGQLIWLEDDLIPDAVRLIGATHSFGQSTASERWTGVILPGTGSAWSSWPSQAEPVR